VTFVLCAQNAGGGGEKTRGPSSNVSTPTQRTKRELILLPRGGKKGKKQKSISTQRQ